MDERKIHQLIGCIVVAFVAYHLLSFIVPYMMYAVIGLVLFLVLLNKSKR